MKISKLLSIILGLSGFLRMGIVEGEGGGMSMHDAGAALTGLVDTDGEGKEETEESAAERLAAEEAEGATPAGDEAGEQAAEAASTKITIEVDGKTIELDKADLPELYKNGLRQKDYTVKTMEASEQRKAADAEIAKAKADRDAYAQKLNTFAITTSSALQAQQQELTQDLLERDPQEYLRQQHIFQQRQVELGKANAELERLKSEYQQEQQHQAQQFMQSQRETLLAAVPALKDPEKAAQFFKDIEGFMGKAGFKSDDGQMVLDARVILMADKAQKYDALMARAKDAASKVKAAPVKVERPGVKQVAPTDGRTQGMKQLAKTGSVRDAGALLAGML